ncbi:hypothetical protein AURDEDRAFT_123993 [Auricularia subglabra TFB-10046 SS5]|nr:hypothetical protein AURDEDRAFT_123993 [Auricularia subglabra TFB-10046 SS5]
MTLTFNGTSRNLAYYCCSKGSAGTRLYVFFVIGRTEPGPDPYIQFYLDSKSTPGEAYESPPYDEASYNQLVFKSKQLPQDQHSLRVAASGRSNNVLFDYAVYTQGQEARVERRKRGRYYALQSRADLGAPLQELKNDKTRWDAEAISLSVFPPAEPAESEEAAAFRAELESVRAESERTRAAYESARAEIQMLRQAVEPPPYPDVTRAAGWTNEDVAKDRRRVLGAAVGASAAATTFLVAVLTAGPAGRKLRGNEGERTGDLVRQDPVTNQGHLGRRSAPARSLPATRPRKEDEYERVRAVKGLLRSAMAANRPPPYSSQTFCA